MQTAQYILQSGSEKTLKKCTFSFGFPFFSQRHRSGRARALKAPPGNISKHDFLRLFIDSRAIFGQLGVILGFLSGSSEQKPATERNTTPHKPQPCRKQHRPEASAVAGVGRRHWIISKHEFLVSFRLQRMLLRLGVDEVAT